MKLEVISPEALIYKGEVALVQMPGALSPFEVLVNHAPMVSVLEKGKIKVIDTDRNLFYIDIGGGLAHIEKNSILVLTNSTDH